MNLFKLLQPSEQAQGDQDYRLFTLSEVLRATQEEMPRLRRPEDKIEEKLDEVLEFIRDYKKAERFHWIQQTLGRYNYNPYDFWGK